MPQLTLHGKTHPPLATLFLWVLTRMGLGIFGASLATILFGSLTLVFVYGISHDLFGEEAARIGVGVFWLVPAVILYSAVSMDALFMFLCAATIFFFQRTLYETRYAAFLALFFGLALFSTFVAGFLLLVFAVWIGLSYVLQSLPTNAYRNLAWGAGFTVLIHLALYWGLNYNVFDVFFQARNLNAAMMSSPQARPYNYWVIGNLIDYFTFLGFPLFSVVCLYGWKIKKKSPYPISRLWRFYSPSLSLTSPAL
jgi:4-amino-4-deoxy-L-arabinose transferase-like glycosyltransferase